MLSGRVIRDGCPIDSSREQRKLRRVGSEKLLGTWIYIEEDDKYKYILLLLVFPLLQVRTWLMLQNEWRSVGGY